MPHDEVKPGRGESSATLEHPGVEIPAGVVPDDPAAHAVRLALARGVERLRQLDPAARQGDAEGVHQMRTAARRVRSELRLFRGLLEGDLDEQLSAELRWLGHLLGAVRDRDVLGQRLRASAGELAEELGPLFDTLASRRGSALAELREALEGPRYRSLLGHLAEVAEHSLLRDEAWEPCRTTLPSLVRRLWRRLRSTGRALDLSGRDEDYHEVRKRAKRARYGAESVAPALDPESSAAARRFAKRARAVQDILGEHQDATLACREIRNLSAVRNGDGPFNLAAGRLLERQEVAASAARTRFFKSWQKLDRKKNRRWMKV